METLNTLGLRQAEQKLIYFRYGDFPQQAVLIWNEVCKSSKIQEKKIELSS